MTEDRESAGIAQAVLDHDRFAALWERFSIEFQPSHCESVFGQLAELYTGEDRFYHCAEHINLCLSKLDEARDSSGNSDAVEMAVWFHDAIFTAGDPDNEYKSARWFRQCAEQHVAEDDIVEVERLIVATTHRDTPANWREQLLVDVDLSSFGLPWDKFLQDGRNIRREFSELTDNEFVTSQGRFLQRLLDRPTIYHTDYFQQNYEQTARDNIQRILTDYDRGLAP